MNYFFCEKVFKFFHRLLDFIEYLFKLLSEGFGTPFTPDVKSIRKHDSLCLLSNGPSLKEYLYNTYSENEQKIHDFLVVNDFAKSPDFDIVKPQICVWSDPMFFIHTPFEERGRNAIKLMAEKTQWPLTLFVPKIHIKSSFMEPIRENTNITIRAFRSFEYKGFECFRHWFEKRGLGAGQYGNVSINAVYIAMMLGYKNIYLHGVDYTFFNGLCVNDNNELCMKEVHFFDDQPPTLKPLMCQYPGFEGVYKVSYYIYEMGWRFKGNDIMASLAKSMGVNIYNCVKNSMLDSYERKY